MVSTSAIEGSEEPGDARERPPEVLDRRIIEKRGAIDVVERWLRGPVGGRGKVIKCGLSGGPETIEMEERIHASRLFCVQP